MGHTIDFVDPSRAGVDLNREQLCRLRCIQHSTYTQHVNSILKLGLHPGGLPGMDSASRNSVHCGAFPPFDERLRSGARKGSKDKGKTSAAVYLKPNTVALNNTFTCTTSGALLTNTPIPPWCIDYVTRFNDQIEEMRWDSMLVGCHPWFIQLQDGRACIFDGSQPTAPTEWDGLMANTAEDGINLE